VKEQEKYSKHWKQRNWAPSRRVSKKDKKHEYVSHSSKKRCAQVKVAEEVSNKKVLRRGREKGDKGVMPVEGQTEPTSMAGEREEWK